MLRFNLFSFPFPYGIDRLFIKKKRLPSSSYRLDQYRDTRNLRARKLWNFNLLKAPAWKSYFHKLLACLEKHTAWVWQSCQIQKIAFFYSIFYIIALFLNFILLLSLFFQWGVRNTPREKSRVHDEPGWASKKSVTISSRPQINFWSWKFQLHNWLWKFYFQVPPRKFLKLKCHVGQTFFSRRAL